MEVWVVTGGAACGKGRAVGQLADLLPSCALFDADKAVHEELTNPTTIGKLTEVFGGVVLSADKAIDRPKLREIILQSGASRRRLEAILHPLVRQQFADTVAEAASKLGSRGVLLAEIPLFYETEGPYACDRVVAVCASPENQRARLQKRGLSKEQAKQLIESQLPIGIKLERADVAIWNDGDEDSLQEQILLLSTLAPGGEPKS